MNWEALYTDTIVLLPAYGRDYTSATDAEFAFLSNRDFMCELSGKYANLSDLKNLLPSVQHAKLRYNKRSLSTTVDIPNNP
jgi:hypothetical protein